MPPTPKGLLLFLALGFLSSASLAGPSGADVGVSKNAAFYRDHCLFIKNGFLKAESATPGQILNEYERQSFGKPLVIHFHGGLVSESSAKKEAAELYNSCYGAVSYPVYFVWNADFFTELGAALDTRYHNIAFVQGHLSTAAFLQGMYEKVKAGGVDLSGMKSGLVSAYRRFMNQDPSFQKAVSQQAAQDSKEDILASGQSLADWGKLDTWVTAKDRIQKKVTNYFSPYVEGIVKYHDSKSVSWSGDLLEWVSYNFGGRDIWSRMKQDTADSFSTRYGIQGAGLLFLKALAQHPHIPRVVLVGHSTGCIYIFNFLRAAKALMPGTKFDVIFLAPANTYQDSARFLAQYGDTIGNFRMFGIRDKSERRDHMLWEINPQLEGLYPGSLLFFVSRAAENRHNVPILGLDRDYTLPPGGPDRDANLTVRRLLLNEQRKIVWSPTDGPMGASCTCLSHGNFYSDQRTLNSLRYLIKNSGW